MKPSLNPQQEKIVNHIDGPALVIAGAGSGKTMVITQRVANLIKNGVSPDNILLLTFTNKAAKEMLERVQKNLPEYENIGVMGGTFHSIANRLLRKYAQYCGYENNFTILDQADARELIKLSVAENVSLKPKGFPKVNLMQSIFSLSFNLNLELGQLLSREYPYLVEFEGELTAIQNSYRKKKKGMNVMDFDDLLDNLLLLLSTRKDLPAVNRIRYILVDEYQDTNQIQADIIDQFTRNHDNLMVVGDDAQSIYGWRGADFKNIIQFDKRYPSAVTYNLEVNYRSSREILDLANYSINLNTVKFTKNLQAVVKDYPRPQWNKFNDEDEEADWICQKILEMNEVHGVPFKDICISYRAHAHSTNVQVSLRNNNIPFMLRSGISFFDQSHIKDVLSFIKVIYNQADELAWNRLFKFLPGVGASTGQKILKIIYTTSEGINSDIVLKAVPKKGKERWKSLVDLLKDVNEEKDISQIIMLILNKFYDEEMKTLFENYRERREDIVKLAGYAQKFKNLDQFMSELSLMGNDGVSEEDEEKQKDDAVTLTTIHQAKGLEWENMFIIGLNEGMFPSSRSLENEEKLEEERRLFYVAVTRAKKGLFLSSARNVTLFGSYQYAQTSRFIDEVQSSLLNKSEVPKPETSYVRHRLRFE